jgi:ATP-dependent Lon protease
VLLCPCECADNIYLQPALYSNNELWSRLGQPGVAVGLAWTSVGGEVLLVEANKMEGDGELVLTGHLGDVMKESARLALNWVRTSAREVRHIQFSLLVPESSDICWLCIHISCLLFPWFCSMACR